MSMGGGGGDGWTWRDVERLGVFGDWLRGELVKKRLGGGGAQGSSRMGECRCFFFISERGEWVGGESEFGRNVGG